MSENGEKTGEEEKVLEKAPCDSEKIEDPDDDMPWSIYQSRVSKVVIDPNRDARGAFIEEPEQPFEMDTYINHPWHQTMTETEREAEIRKILIIFINRQTPEVERMAEFRWFARKLERFAYEHKTFVKKEYYMEYLEYFRNLFVASILKDRKDGILKEDENPSIDKMEELCTYLAPRGELPGNQSPHLSTRADVVILADQYDFDPKFYGFDINDEPNFTHIEPETRKGKKGKIGVNNRKIAIAKYTTKERPEDESMLITFEKAAFVRYFACKHHNEQKNSRNASKSPENDEKTEKNDENPTENAENNGKDAENPTEKAENVENQAQNAEDNGKDAENPTEKAENGAETVQEVSTTGNSEIVAENAENEVEATPEDLKTGNSQNSTE